MGLRFAANEQEQASGRGWYKCVFLRTQGVGVDGSYQAESNSANHISCAVSNLESNEFAEI